MSHAQTARPEVGPYLGVSLPALQARGRAILTNENYIAQCSAQGIYPLSYYPHNIHFLSWAAMREGQSKEAIEATRKDVKYPG